MKFWNEYGSEHSMNLVMIGHFKEVRDAEKTRELIDRLTGRVIAEPEVYQSEAGLRPRRFSDSMLELLRASELYTIGPAELEQFGYDAHVRVEGSKVVLTTDEADVSAFLKVLLEKGARIEVYSAHDHPGTGHGRSG
jgi:hypothetical protein